MSVARPRLGTMHRYVSLGSMRMLPAAEVDPVRPQVAADDEVALVERQPVGDREAAGSSAPARRAGSRPSSRQRRRSHAACQYALSAVAALRRAAVLPVRVGADRRDRRRTGRRRASPPRTRSAGCRRSGMQLPVRPGPTNRTWSVVQCWTGLTSRCPPRPRRATNSARMRMRREVALGDALVAAVVRARGSSSPSVARSSAPGPAGSRGCGRRTGSSRSRSRPRPGVRM